MPTFTDLGNWKAYAIHSNGNIVVGSRGHTWNGTLNQGDPKHNYSGVSANGTLAISAVGLTPVAIIKRSSVSFETSKLTIPTSLIVHESF